MKACVLDASVVVKWFLDEDGSEAARALRSSGPTVAAPHLLFLEVANVLWKHVRKGLLDIEMGSEILLALEEAPIEWHEDVALLREAYGLATELGRTGSTTLCISPWRFAVT